MSNLFKYTKRVLTSVLAAAVVLTAIPSTAFGADNFDENIDLVEAVETVEEAQEQEIAEQAEEVIPEEAVVEEDNSLDAEAALEGEIFAEGEEEEADQGSDGTKRTITLATVPAKYPGGSSAQEYVFTYGDTFGNVVTTATSSPALGTEGIKWTLYTYTQAAIDDGVNPATDATYQDDSSIIEEVTDSWLAGYGLTKSTTADTFTLSGRPSKIMDTTYFMLKAEDAANNEGSRKSDVVWADKINVTINGKAVDFTAKNSGTAEKANDGSGVISTTPPVDDPIVFSGASGLENVNSMGYEVYKKASDVPATVEDAKTYVVAETVEIGLDSTTLDDDYPINDLKYTWKGDDKNSFEPITKANGLTDGNGVSNNKKETIYIAPKKGLTALGDTDHDGVYVAELEITSDKIAATKTVYVEFTVTSALAITSVTDAEGKERVGTNDKGTVANPYELGEFEIGEQISAKIVAKNNTTDTVSMVGLFTADGPFGAQALDNLPDDLTLSVTDSDAGYAEMTLSGAVTDTSIADGADFYFAVCPSDDETTAAISSAQCKLFHFTVVNACDVVEISIDDEAIESGKTDSDNKYYWFAPNHGGSDDDYPEAVATATIKNNGKASLDFTVGTSNTSLKGNVEAASNPTSFTLAAGAEKEIEFTPTVEDNDGLAVDDNLAQAVLTISATGFETTTAALEFATTSATGVEITKPAVDGADIDDLVVGKSYSYAFKATTVDSNTTWTVTNVSSSTISDASIVSATAIKDLADFGLALSSAGVLSGTPAKAGSIWATVKVSTNTAKVDKRIVKLTAAANDEGLTAKSGTKELGKTEATTLDLGSIARDKTGTVTSDISLVNNNVIEQKGVKAAVTAITKNGSPFGAGSETDYFDIVYDANDETKNDMLYTNGLDLGAGASGTVKLVAKDLLGSGAGAGVGTYVATVRVTGADSNPIEFNAKLKVTTAVVIDPSAITGFVKGTNVPEASAPAYADVDGGTYNYKVTGGKLPDGLSLDYASGKVYGTPTKVGEFEVTVTAYTPDTKKEAVGSITHKIEVAGNSTLKVSITGDADVEGDSIILPGVVVGGTLGKLKVSVSAAGEAATNVKVAIADSEDDRDPSVAYDVADYKKNPANPYTGSTNFIGVSTASLGEVVVDADDKSFDITQKAATKAGVYKATVTVSADNASPVKLEAIFVVTDKLAITQPATLATSIGSAIAAEKYTLSATGGAKDQTIVWAENGTKEDPASDEKTYYITAAGGEADGGSAKTGLALSANGMKIGNVPAAPAKPTAATSGLMNDIQTAAMQTAGTYTVSLGASVAACKYGDLDGTYDVKNIIDRSATFAANKATVVIEPKQTATAVSFNIESTGSKKAFVYSLAHSSGSVSVNGANTIGGTVTGSKIGNRFATITGYTWPATVEGYSNTGEQLTIAVNDPDDSGLLEATPKLKTGTNFTLTSRTKKTLDDAGTAAWVVQPKSGLKEGTYSDTVSFEGTNIETVSLPITFKVEKASYKMIVDNNVAPDALDVSGRVVYANNNVVDSKALIELPSIVKGGTESSTSVTIAIRNSGNSDISGIEVYEAKNKNGDEYGTSDDGPFLTVSAVSATSLATTGGVDPLNDATFTMQIASAADAGEFNTFVAIKSTEGSLIVIPVKCVVMDTNLTKVSVTPEENATSGYVTVPAKSEGYTSKDAGLTFTIKNNNTAASQSLEGLAVSLEGGSNFGVFTDLEENYLDAGKSATFVIAPVPGLEAGTYTDTVKIAGSNIKNSPIKRKITFTVTENKQLVLDKVNASNDVHLDGSLAERLYNTVTIPFDTTTVPAVTPATASTGHQIVAVDLDANGADDITIDFTGNVSSGTLDAVSAADITIAGTNNITAASKMFSLTTSQQDAIKVNPAAVGAKTCFTSVTFKLYTVMTYGAVTTVYSDLKDDLDKPDDNGGWFVLAAGYADPSTLGDGSIADPRAKGTITAYVPFGSTAVSVFTKNNKLPTAVDSEQISSGWKDTASPYNALHPTDRVYKDATYEPTMYSFVYAADGSTDANDGVAWKWTEGNNGDVDAVLTLTDVSGDYDNESKIEVTKDSKPAISGYPSVYAPVTITDKGIKEATCTHGGHREYQATATVDFSGSDQRVYTGIYRTKDDGKAKGHTYATTVTWEKQEDGLYKPVVTQTCTVCEASETGHTFTATVVKFDTEVTKKPTCTEAGEATFKLVSFVDGNGKTISGEDIQYIANNTFKTAIDPTGHKYKLVVVWNEENHKTATSARLVCDQCAATETGHEVDVTSQVTYDTKYDEKTGVVVSNQAIYHAGEKDEVKSEIWYNHTCKWTLLGWTWAGPTKATANFKCTTGGETQDIDATPTVVKTLSNGNKKYLAAVVGPDDLQYSDEKWYDKDGNPTSGEGIGIEGIEDEYEYTGKPIKPEPIVRDYATDAILVKGTDYSVKYENNKNVGTATITVTGKGNYGEKGGTATATFTIVDPTKDEKPEDYFTIKSVKVTSKDGFTYNGEEKFPATLTIKTSEGDVTATWDGSSYNLNVDSSKEMHINVSNNVNKGSGIVAVTGNDGKGKFVTKSATFAIKACDLSTAGDNLNVTASPAPWAVKGAKAPVEVTFMSETLVEGRDYTLSYSYPSKKNAGTGAGKVTVKGKNNFTKKFEQTFDITPFQITKVNSVVAYAGLKVSGIKVTMYDGQGVVIPAKNYTATFEVFSKEGLAITDSRYKLQAGDKVNVTVKAATANLDGEETLADIVVGANLAKAKITVPKSFTKTFTGEEINLDENDFGSGKITVGSYEYGEDFIITGYQNNVKKGTMTVFIQGVSDKVSGVSKFKVKIVPKKVTPAK